MKYPVGPQTQAKAAKTEPGKMAAALNRVLYSADAREVLISNTDPKQGTIKGWVAQVKVFKNNDELPSGVAPHGDNGLYFLTEDLMRAIRDYLEFRSFEEVIP